MDFLKLAVALPIMAATTGCQLGYVLKSAKGQMGLFYDQVPITNALQDPKISEEEKRKLLLAQKARDFAEKKLHLKPTKNYTSYVHLDRPYVTYVVSAAPKWELQHHLFSYPLVGSMPYKGYFQEDDARELQQELQQKNFDTYMRGVSAYSTLGWFQDPLLSSMLRYKDHDLVNTIIHEIVHATLYVKQEADFNERLAVFLGNKGMELFYLQEEGDLSLTLQKVKAENEDDKLFSKFITRELNELEKWYKNFPPQQRNEEVRQRRIDEIKTRFKNELLPFLQSDNYKKFVDANLNNARLLVYKTYLQDLSDFEALYLKVNKNFEAFIAACKELENEKDPAGVLKRMITSENSHSKDPPLSLAK